MTEFINFEKYVEFIESKGAHKIGLAKIVTPKEWCARKSGYSYMKTKIDSRIKQTVHGKEGIFTQFNTKQRSMNLNEFKTLAYSDKQRTPSHIDFADLERIYWEEITSREALYGADISESLMDKEQKIWNIGKLDNILNDLKDEHDIEIQGLNTPYLYFGMWKTSFARHTEDMDLYSISYLHFGEPKKWYVIPPENGESFEHLAGQLFPEAASECKAFLRHKNCLISHYLIEKIKIPYARTTQEAGQFIIIHNSLCLPLRL
jgi:[histone H3]-trimethyl-L-lysine9/36 demethylase